MNFFVILLLFTIWRIFDFLILFLAPKFIPYLGFFPYKEILPLYHLPEWLTKLANFDGVHYLLIAQQGYMQYEQAFFPLYSILIKLLTPVFFNNSFLAGFMISNVLFLLGLWVFSKYLIQDQKSKIKNQKLDQRTKASMKQFDNLTKLTIFFLLSFPTSFFFGAIYTEGLFFFLFISSLYFLKKHNYFLAGILAVFASFTKLMGLFLIIPLAINIFRKFKISNLKFKIFSLLSPFFGLIIYCFYLWKTTGDPLFFLSSQPIFGAHRSTSLILLPQVYWRYLKILFTAQHDFRYYVSLFEFTTFTFVFIVLIFDLFNIIFNRNPKSKNQMSNQAQNPNKNRLFKNLSFGFDLKFGFRTLDLDRLALNIFSLANLLLPTLTGTFSSIPRYALLSFSFFIFLSQIKNNWVKITMAIIFLIFHILILGFFGQGYFVG